MKCIDCIEKDQRPINEAQVYLINDYESVRPLCQSCFDEYAYVEGEMNLDSYYIVISGTDQVEFINGINRVLKYLNEMNKRFRDRYFAAKKLGKKWSELQPSPYDDGLSDLPESITLTKKHGIELLEILEWPSSIKNQEVKT